MPRLVPTAVLGLLATGGLVVAAWGADVTRETLERLNVQETVLNAEQGRNLNRLARMLTVLAQFRRDPPPALLVSPGDATQAVRAAILVKAMTPEMVRRAKVYAAEANDIARQRRLAAVASETLFTTDSAMADLRGAPAAEPQLERLPPPDTGPLVAPTRLAAPVNGTRVQAFGAPLVGGGRASGMTLQTAAGAKVQAPADALVQYAGPVKGWGTILILRLAGGYHLVLAGMDRSTVVAGARVSLGSPLGWMPEAKQAPAELYLEVREAGVPVDPARWMKSTG
jgi:septal ring factor EnvC (AmiA/AmiB activator)